MKQSTLQSYWIVALLGLALGATHLQAQNIARGRSFLKVEAYLEAYDEFLKETQLKPQDPEAQTLAGLANFVNITKSDGFNSFLDRLGFDKQGRELDDWTSAMDTEAMKERLKSEKMNGQELADFIQNGLISNLEKSLNHFKAIPTGKSFLIFLSEDETQISDLFLDQGDVSMIQALIELICFTLNGVSAQDMHVDIQSILNLLDDEISADAFMSLNPDFMKNVSQNNLKAARASFIGFIDYYMAGSELLKNRTTKTLNHLVSIDEEEEELEADFREHLNHLRFEESLNSLFRLEIKESTVTFSADPMRLFETPLRSLTRVDGLVGVIHQEAEQMATQLDRDIAKLSNISRARIIQPDIDSEGRMPDGADILLLQGDIQLARALSATLSAHDLDIGVQEIIKLRNQEKLDAQNILRTKPALLDLKTPSVMPHVRDWLANARQNLKDGYTLFQSRREGKVGIIIPDVSALDEIIGTLDTILSSETKAHELSAPFKESNYLINPAPLWTGEVNLRNLLPRFNGNEPIQGTLPDSTMAGLFPDKIFINSESKIGQEPKPGDVIWEFKTGGYVHSSPAIGSDGTIYVGSNDSNLYAINPDGSKKWEFKTGSYVHTSPAIGSDGTIYVGSGDNNLYAINPDGSKKWAFRTGGRLYTSPAIGSDGTIYVGSDDSNLYAINPDGSKKWEFKTGRLHSSPAIGSDGTIYVGSYDHNLYAINPDGSKKWEFETGGDVRSSPAIGSDGTIYLGSADFNLYAINPDGSKKWEFKTGGYVYSSPAIGSDGTIYVGSGDLKYVGSGDNNLYAINPDGTKKWSLTTGHLAYSSPAIGSDGTIITSGITTYVGSFVDNNLYAINPDGSKKWEFKTGGGWLDSSPAIGSDGTIYIGSYDDNLYAIKTSITGPADSPWPMFGHNTQRTGAIPQKPIITLQPTDQTASIGSGVEFVVKVTGTEPLEYQWYKDGKVINGAKKNSYSISSLNETDYGFYSVRVKNDLGKAISALVELKKIKAPQIITQPKSNYVFLGSNLKLEVIAEGSEPLSYQWYKDSEPLNAPNSPELEITAIKESDYGSYYVEVSNKAGTKRGEVVMIKQAKVPTITEQPAFQELEYGSNAEFQVTAVGTEPLDYLWFKDGKPIDNATTSLLRLENITKEDEAIYSVRVKNLFGKAISKIAKLKVKTYPPLITLQPKSIERNLGDTGVFSILATGNKPLRYQWYKNGKAIKGATEPTLTITNISEDDITIFSVSVNNDFGKAISKIAQLNRKGKLKWVYKAEDKLPSDPAIDDDGTVYIGSLDGKLHAIDGETGKKKWDLQTEGKISEHITIGSNEYVYFISWIYSEDEILTGNKIVAVDPESKKIKWDYYLDSSKDNTIIGSFTIGRNSNLFITTDPKYEGGWLVSPKLIELNGDKGILNWDMDLTQAINTSSAMDNNGIIYSTTGGSLSYALDTKDQSIVWSVNTGSQQNAGTIMDLSNIYTIISYKYNYDLNQWVPIDQLIAISSKDGQSLWKLNLPEPVLGMSLGPNGNLVFGISPEYNRETNQWDSQPKLYSVNAQDGEIQWVKNVQGAIWASPAISQDNTIYVGTRGIWDEENGVGEIIIHPKFYAIDGDNGKTKWTFDGGGSFFSSPAIAKDGTVIVGSNGTEATGWKVYAFEGTSPLADSAWPMRGQNPKRTFNTTEYITRKYTIITIPDKTALPFTVSFTTAEGSTYVFQASGDLKNWSKVEEVKGTGGEVKVTDLREAIFQKQYYRVKLVE